MKNKIKDWILGIRELIGAAVEYFKQSKEEKDLIERLKKVRFLLKKAQDSEAHLDIEYIKYLEHSEVVLDKHSDKLEIQGKDASSIRLLIKPIKSVLHHNSNASDISKLNLALGHSSDGLDILDDDSGKDSGFESTIV